MLPRFGLPLHPEQPLVRLTQPAADLPAQDVSLETILHWEKNQTEPPVHFWPGIVSFLGYCPYQRAETFGDRLKLHRTHQGLSQRDLAKILDVDPGSLSRWESGKRQPSGRIRKLLEVFMQYERC